MSALNTSAVWEPHILQFISELPQQEKRINRAGETYKYHVRNDSAGDDSSNSPGLNEHNRQDDAHGGGYRTVHQLRLHVVCGGEKAGDRGAKGVDHTPGRHPGDKVDWRHNSVSRPKPDERTGDEDQRNDGG
jgi:hypothetical protein